MAHKRFEARRPAPLASGLVLGVRPIFLIAAALSGLVVLWIVWTVLASAQPVFPN